MTALEIYALFGAPFAMFALFGAPFAMFATGLLVYYVTLPKRSDAGGPLSNAPDPSSGTLPVNARSH